MWQFVKQSSRTLPLAAAAIVATVTLIVWNGIRVNEERNHRELISQLTHSLVQAIDAELYSNSLALDRMAKRWESSADPTRTQWESDALRYVADFGGRSVNLVNANRTLRWSVPPVSHGNQFLGREEKLDSALAEARVVRSTLFAGPFEGVGGRENEIIGIHALYKNNKLDGYLFMSIGLDSILERAVVPILLPHTQVTLKADDKVLAQIGQIESVVAQHGNDQWVPLSQVHGLSLLVSHDTNFSSGHPDTLSLLVLLSGLLSSLLVGSVVWFWIEENHRTLESEAARRKIQDREARLAAIVDTSVEGIIIIDDRGIVESMNPAAERMFGYRNDEVAGRNVSMLMPEPYKSAHDNYIRRYLENGVPHIIGIGREVEGLRKNGELFPLDLSVSEMKVNGRRMFTGMLRDISERKANEAALHEKQQLLDSVVENIPAMVFMKRADDLRFVLFNKAGEHLLGFSREELLDRNDYDFFPEEQADFFVDKDREVLAAGFMDIPEESIDTRNRGKRILHTKKISLNDQTGSPQYLLGISYDITDEKAAEARLIEAKEEAIKANLAKSQFLATVSHELRTPLTSISGALDLLSSGKLGDMSEQSMQMVDIAQKNSKRLAHLINDLLDMEKLSAGKLRLELSLQPLMPLVNQSLESISTYADQFQVGIDLAGLADDVQVNVDGDRLQQILQNLLSNAIKFSPKGGCIEVVVSRSIDKARIEVIDHGPGIPMGFRSRIFQKFSQADSSDNRKIGGTGLGLAISKELAERMNCSVGFVSEEGKGTCFYVELPISVIASPGGTQHSSKETEHF